jgi:rhamnulokinase
MTKVAAAAVDLGSSSGRVVVGTLTDGSLSLEEVHRFPHAAHSVDGVLVWDLDHLEEQVGVGIDKALAERDEPVRSVAVDTWGVDYALLAAGGQRYGQGRAYRDPRTASVAAEFYSRATAERRWLRTGVKPDDINTANQLFADLACDPDLPEKVERVLLLPDYFAYRLSGQMGWGRSISSTTGLCEAEGGRWSPELLDLSQIPAQWLGPVQPDIAVRGRLRGGRWDARSGSGVQVLNSAGHDTACAVHALPKEEDGAAAFISSGSWSIVGVETAAPVLCPAALEAGLTNEARADGGNQLIANITGLWILQECQRAWGLEGGHTGIEELLVAAERSQSTGMVLDPDDQRFRAPGGMPDKVQRYCQEHYQSVPASRGQMVRVILESLALSYAMALRKIAQIVDRRWDVVHLVGGGAYNPLLCQMTASATGMAVVAGPAEASAVGNLLAQFEVAGAITSQRQRHEIVRASFSPRTYEPGRQEPWLAMEGRLGSYAARH